MPQPARVQRFVNGSDPTSRWTRPRESRRACRALSRVTCPIQAATPDGARATIAARIDHYNHHRLPSAIGYITPRDKLLGLDTVIWAERDRKLEEARESRRKRRELDHLGTAA
ncbi:MAG: hypothetical protein H7066_17975 [Cytophagaceae bacterium]|nr:hypothetical protein [Gemmatimonadaceae bacterium]